LLRAQVWALAHYSSGLGGVLRVHVIKDAHRQLVPRQVVASWARVPPEPGSASRKEEPLGKELDPLHPDRPASWRPASRNDALLTVRPTERG
jgi:hypothetical protein